MKLPCSSIFLTILTLCACGRPDASGLYLYKADGEVALVQLTHTPGGTVSGRLERLSIGPGGVLADQSTVLDGAALSGPRTHDALQLGGKPFRRATQKDYQAAVAQLQARAGAAQRQAAEAEANRAAAAVQASGFDTATDKAGRLTAAAAKLRDASTALDAGVDAAPDYGKQAADNSARIAAMAAQAKALPAPGRASLAASAVQLASATNQIDAARSQAANALNRIVQTAAPLAAEVQRFCASTGAATYKRPCAEAATAATGFESSLVHASTLFKVYKQAVHDERMRQNEMVQKLSG